MYSFLVSGGQEVKKSKVVHASCFKRIGFADYKKCLNTSVKKIGKM